MTCTSVSLSDEVVVRGADGIHQARLFACGLDGGNDRKAFLPAGDHLGEELRRLLQIGGDSPDSVAIRLEEGVHGRAEMAEVTRIHDDLHLGKFRCHGAQHGDGAVVRGVIDKDVPVLILRHRVHDRAGAAMEFANVEFFVVSRA